MPRSKEMLARQRSMQEVVEETNQAAEAEAAAKADKETKPDIAKPAEVAPIDGAKEEGQVSDTAQPAEGELERAIAEKVAKRLGWVPLDEWKRDPAKHRSAEQFLEDTPKQLEAHKEQARRAAQAAEAAFEEERRQLLTTAEAKARAAVEAKDPDAAAAAVKEAAGDSPRVTAWIAAHPWFTQDPAARIVAAKATGVAHAAGLTEQEQLEAAELAVKKRFPEYFEREETSVALVREAPKEEVRLSEIKRAPAVNAPSRTTPSEKPNKEKGYGDIPQAMRQDFERHQLRKFTGRGLTTEQAQTRYAQAYWKELPA